MNQQRRRNRQDPEWRKRHAMRKNCWIVLQDRKTGEIVVEAKDGCFGRLRKFKDTREAYDMLAAGTAGAY